MWHPSSVFGIACHVFVTTVPMTNNCMSHICDIRPVRVKLGTAASSWAQLSASPHSKLLDKVLCSLGHLIQRELSSALASTLLVTDLYSVAWVSEDMPSLPWATLKVCSRRQIKFATSSSSPWEVCRKSWAARVRLSGSSRTHKASTALL